MQSNLIGLMNWKRIYMFAIRRPETGIYEAHERILGWNSSRVSFSTEINLREQATIIEKNCHGNRIMWNTK